MSDPPTTRAILAAPHRVLLRDGTKGLTLVAVAREAHVDVTTVSYHFGTRHGLIEALMDRLYAGPTSEFAARVADLPDIGDRFHAYFDGVRSMYADRDATQAYFEIAVMALRDPALRSRLAQLNKWIINEFGTAIEADPQMFDRVRAELTFAAVDGIELHRALAGDDYSADEVLDLLERLLRTTLPGGVADVRSAEEGSGGRDGGGGASAGGRQDS
ncbi:TetR/AcrR family transcriptional regulator [Streptomyces sp. NPDC059894]|uniref:TetR/AcrR family transcriptional regulator n=1 Tax=unclassified Streptomyces TaxID=2593676 RepID=UPI003654F029